MSSEPTTAIDWFEVMLDGLCASDGGNNPFYGDDDDTVSLARELAELVETRLRLLTDGAEPPEAES